MLRLAGGTDAGDEEASAVWNDEKEGVARLLRSASAAGLRRVALIGATPEGDLYVASTAVSAEETIGYFHRGIAFLIQAAEGEAAG